MAHQYMPKMFHDPTKYLPPPPTYLMYGRLLSFVNFNKYLQREEPLILRLHDRILQFLKRIARKFLQIDFVANGDMFSDAWREQENQKSRSFNI